MLRSRWEKIPVRWQIEARAVPCNCRCQPHEPYENLQTRYIRSLAATVASCHNRNFLLADIGRLSSPSRAKKCGSCNRLSRCATKLFMLLELHVMYNCPVQSRWGAGLWAGCVETQIEVSESTTTTISPISQFPKTIQPNHSYFPCSRSISTSAFR